ncbi:MAG: hypothetical protein LBU60_06155 [Clostridiales bacterium]|jgi:hypothetical protein|nr:hypothetical protein [Clostridiales bacterium]
MLSDEDVRDIDNGISKKGIKKVLKRNMAASNAFGFGGCIFFSLGILALVNAIRTWVNSGTTFINIILSMLFLMFIFAFGLGFMWMCYYRWMLRINAKIAFKKGVIAVAKIYKVTHETVSTDSRHGVAIDRKLYCGLKYTYEINGVQKKSRTANVYSLKEKDYYMTLDSIAIKVYKNKTVVVEPLGEFFIDYDLKIAIDNFKKREEKYKRKNDGKALPGYDAEAGMSKDEIYDKWYKSKHKV